METGSSPVYWRKGEGAPAMDFTSKYCATRVVILLISNFAEGALSPFGFIVLLLQP